MRDEPLPDDSPQACGPYVHGVFALVGRSLFPLVTIVLVVGTTFWGPWVTLVCAILVWNIVTHFG